MSYNKNTGNMDTDKTIEFSDNFWPCPVCDGEGYQEELDSHQSHNATQPETHEETCWFCNGVGKFRLSQILSRSAGDLDQADIELETILNILHSAKLK